MRVVHGKEHEFMNKMKEERKMAAKRRKKDVIQSGLILYSVVDKYMHGTDGLIMKQC